MTTRSSWIVFAATTLVGGCSIIYNPDNIATRQDAKLPDDANPANLTLTDIGPKEILEGQGDGGSHPAVLVLHGSNFIASATVELIAATTVHIDVDNTKLQVSPDTQYLAVPVTAHVDDTLPDGMLVPLTVKVTQPVPGGDVVSQMLDGQLSLHGLDTLTGTVADCDALKKPYAKIATTGTFALSSTMNKPCVFTAVSSITMGDLTAKGRDASSTTGGASGAGGCPGGNGRQAGPCVGHGGAAASGALLSAGGGGGAGFAAMGGDGVGGSHGMGGLSVGDNMIPTYVDVGASKANQGAGGGGGQSLVVIGTVGDGGGGGGGGGIIELTAGGDLTVGTIDVSGGAGTLGGTGTPGGGGGGAGGAIVVRAGGALTTGALASNGGAGGGMMTNDANRGGAGSAGRIRWEAITGSPAGASVPSPMRGVSFAADTPFAVTSPQPSLALVGTPATTFASYSIDKDGHEMSGDGNVPVDAGGMAMTSPRLAAGYNKVCITLNGGMHGAPEATRCIEIAYLP